METNKQNISNRVKNESFGLSLVKIILISALIVFGGALFGAIMFLAVNYSSPIKIAEPVRPSQKEDIKAEAQKYLPKDYAIVSDNFLYSEDVNNDKNKETAVVAEGIGKETLFVLKHDILGYSIAKEFVPDSAQYFQDMSVKDINNDNIPEIIYVTAMGAGESMPRTMKIYEWADGDYKLLVSRTMTAPLSGRPKIEGWIKDFVRDLNYDGQSEIIIPDIGVYQAFCGNSGVCLSLLNYEVYKWDGEKYVEATSDFLEVYNEEIKLANDFLNNPKTSEENKKAIEKYLAEIENMKDVSAWKLYRNENWIIKFPATYEHSNLNEEAETDVFIEKSFQGINIADLPTETLAFSKFAFKKIQTKPANISLFAYVQSLAKKSNGYNEYFQKYIQSIKDPKNINIDGKSVIQTELATFEGCPQYAYWFEKSPTEYMQINTVKCFENGGPFGVEGLTDKQRLAIEKEAQQVLSTFKFIK